MEVNEQRVRPWSAEIVTFGMLACTPRAVVRANRSDSVVSVVPVASAGPFQRHVHLSLLLGRSKRRRQAGHLDVVLEALWVILGWIAAQGSTSSPSPKSRPLAFLLLIGNGKM